MYKKLKEIRYKNKFTTKQMGDFLSISKPYYCQIENGKRKLSYDMAIKIAEIFYKKPDDIFYLDHKNNKK